MERVEIIEGNVSVLDRADVDTDQIIPKQFLKRVERTGFGEFLFYDWIRDGEIELEPNPILVAGRNFGCGSSREHAPWALEDFGFQAILAPSFADIFYSNCTKVGLLPAILDEEHCKTVAAAGEARIDLDDQTVDSAGGVVRFEIDEETKHRLLGGHDEISVTLQSEEAIAAYKHYDLLMVNAMFDGMNLIAKEGPLVNERNGVSLLSENTGAHEELAEFALSVNPFDVQELADAIHSALTMAPEERARRAEGLKEIVTTRDPGDWIDEQIEDISKKARPARTG